MKRTWKFWMGMGTVFFLGLLLGGMLGAGAVQGWLRKLATAPQGELESLVMADWKKKLDLREDQVAAIQPALTEAEAKIVPLRDDFMASIHTVLADLHPKVRAILDPKQQKKYDEMVHRYERKVPPATNAAAAAVGGAPQ